MRGVAAGEERDRTSVGLYLAPGEPDTPLYRMDLRNFFFLIPPGAPRHEVRRCQTFEEDRLVLSITPHMHFLGRAVRYELSDPEGRRETLLFVPEYNLTDELVVHHH